MGDPIDVGAYMPAIRRRARLVVMAWELRTLQESLEELEVSDSVLEQVARLRLLLRETR